MAKDQTMLLQQMVAELRQLNKSSKKDMIREQEALLRQEKTAAVTEETGNTASEVLSDGQDFQRRFIAGRAGQLFDKGKLGKENDEDSKLIIELKKVKEGTQLTLIQTNIPEGQTQYKEGWEEHYFEPMNAYFK